MCCEGNRAKILQDDAVRAHYLGEGHLADRDDSKEDVYGFDLRLDMKMAQQLVMTPQLQQAIRLLQLSRMDSIDAVRDELMDNPLLEERSDQCVEVKVESPQKWRKEKHRNR